MKLNFTIIFLIIVVALTSMGAMIIQEGSSTPDCLEVASASVHAYYEPAFETNLVGWFVEGEPLKLQGERGDWALVSGQGIDTALRKVRMTGWVKASYLAGCH